MSGPGETTVVNLPKKLDGIDIEDRCNEEKKHSRQRALWEPLNAAEAVEPSIKSWRFFCQAYILLHNYDTNI